MLCGDARQRLLKALRHVATYLFWPALGVVIWGELTPGVGIPGVWDKLQHFTAYGGLAGMASLISPNRKRLLWAALALVLMGGILEILQGYTGRDASWWDELANCIGVATGTLMVLWLARGERHGAAQ